MHEQNAFIGSRHGTSHLLGPVYVLRSQQGCQRLGKFVLKLPLAKISLMRDSAQTLAVGASKIIISGKDKVQQCRGLHEQFYSWPLRNLNRFKPSR